MIVKLIQGWFPIPDDICKELGIVEGTPVEIECIEGCIILTPQPVLPPAPKKPTLKVKGCPACLDGECATHLGSRVR